MPSRPARSPKSARPAASKGSKPPRGRKGSAPAPAGPAADDAPAKGADVVDAASAGTEPTEVVPDAESDGPGIVEGDVVEGEVLEAVVIEEVEVEEVEVLEVGQHAEDDGDSEPVMTLAGRGGAMVRSDPLSRYLAAVNRYQRLSAEREHELAVRYRTHGDEDAAGQLITANLRLVVAVAMSFRRAIANVLDLIQEGNIGLMEAVDRFDPYKGTRLSTYATWWIRSRIVKYLLDNWRLVRVGTTNSRRKLLYNLRREKEAMEARGIRPTPRLLAERLGTTTEDVIAVDRALGAADVSLDVPVGEDGTATRGDFLAAEGYGDPETIVADEEFRLRLREVVASFAQGLPPRELALLRERLLADEPCTLQDIADREGVTREAVRQSEARLMVRLRQHVQERFPEAADIYFESRGG